MVGGGDGRWRVLHVITRLDCGGSAENTLVTALGVDPRRYATDIVCGVSRNPPSGNENRAVAAGIRITRIPELVRSVSPLSDLRALAKLYRFVRTNRYDLVHTHTSKAGILGRYAARWAGVPRIVHTPHGHVFYGYFSPPITAFFAWLERRCMRFTDAMITLTQREKRDYLDRRIGSDAVVHPIHSGLELAPYLSAGARREAVRRELGLNDDDFVVGTVARLVPIKNHSLIVQSASRLAPVLPCLRFVFVGDGSLREELEERVRRLGLHHLFRFTGWRTDTADLLSAFDVFAMVSRNEGMGRAFVEAQAAGLPVIGSRVGGVPEVVRENVTGYLVEPDNPAELAECIQMLYTRRASPARTAECCREWVNPRFSAQSMVESIDRLYRSLLESPREQ